MSVPTPPTDSPSRRRLLLAALAMLVAVVPILIVVFLLGSGTGAPATATAARGSTFTPVSRSAPRPRRRTGARLPSGAGALVAFPSRPTALAAAPGGHVYATLPLHTSFGSPESVLVRRVRGDWLGVVSVAAGNGHLGWIRDTHLDLIRVDWSLHAILSRHELLVYHAGRLMRRWTVADGRPTAPTPTGTFAVTDRLNTGDPEGPYGCCILALSAKAPHAISDWDGGNRIAVHSTPDLSSIGQSVSHGCLHVTLPEGRYLITHVPLGTPVTISSA